MPNGQVIQHPHWPQRPVHPGPEPIGPPWWGGHPDWCTCGCDPCRCDPCSPGASTWSQDAIRCWNEMQAFRNMVAEIVQGELARGGTAISGVTDGSDAKPGEVGEFVRGSAQTNYAAYPTVTTANVSPLVVPPGDWDLFGIVTISAPVGVASALLSPVPSGITDVIWGAEGAVSGVATVGTMTLNTVRGSFSVPTLLPFAIKVDQSSNSVLSAGIINVILSGRRRR